MPAARAFLVGFAVLLLFLAASEQLPPVWDEGDTAARVDSVIYWCTQVVPKRTEQKSSPFSDAVLRHYFPNTVSREGHPAGYVVTAAAGKLFCDTVLPLRLLSEKNSYRFGPIFLWAMALGAVFYRLEKSVSLSAACFGTVSIILLPRVFTHAQIVFGDSVLMSCWLLSWALFPAALRNRRGAVLWGFVLGMTAAAKFTGTLAVFPFLIYTLVLLRSAKKDAFRVLLFGIPAAAVMFWILNPPIWHTPLSGLAEYVRLNTHRSAYNISILFLGKIYNLDKPLPWWNSLFWTAVTVPAGLLLSGIAVIFSAVVSAVRRVPLNREILLALINWFPLILVRMIPGIPVHDGVRLFVAAFPFFAILAGLGLAHLWKSGRILPRAVSIFVLLGSASSLVWYFPQELSYYNLLIGGLPGAARLGMEATYYWDGLDAETAVFLNADSDAAPILFSAASYGTLTRWQRWEKISAPIETISRPATRKNLADSATPMPYRLYVLQNRGGGFSAIDRRLVRERKPVWVKTAGRIRLPKQLRTRRNPWNLERVPLILVYPISDFQKTVSRNAKDR